MGARKIDPPSTRKRVTKSDSLAAAIERSLSEIPDRQKADEAAEFMLRLCAKAIDKAALDGNPYAVAALAGRIMELLRDLRMTPAARGAKVEGNPLADLIDLLREPEVRHTP